MYLASHATLFAWITIERSKTGKWTIEAHSWLEPETKSNFPVAFEITITVDPATAPHLHFGDFISLCPEGEPNNKWSFNDHRLLQFKDMAAALVSASTTASRTAAGAMTATATTTHNTTQSASSSKDKEASTSSEVVPPANTPGPSSTRPLTDKEENDDDDDDNEIMSEIPKKRQKLNEVKEISIIQEKLFRLSVRVVPMYGHGWHGHEMPGLPDLLGVPATLTATMPPTASTGSSGDSSSKKELKGRET